MKPPQFEYLAPESIDAALAARAQYESTAILAGGQSLVPTLNFRLGAPDAIIDIGRIEGLRDLDVINGQIKVGAMVRQRTVELDDRIHAANPLLREALINVAHIPIRNRGTVVGSLAHADAAAELPAVLLATGGEVDVAGRGGTRTIAAADLFRFHLTTTLEPDEIITAAYFPVLPPGSGWAFDELTRRRGDYAVAAVCAIVSCDAGGACSGARLAACGIGSRAVRLNTAEDVLIGSHFEPDVLENAGEAATDYVEVADDTQASTAYRADVLASLVIRSVERALARAHT